MDKLYNILLPSPIEDITDFFLPRDNLKIFVKREELTHPQIGGNKYRKLKYNILQAQKNNLKYLVSYGGAFSNHLYSLSAICQKLEIQAILFIQCREEDIKNPLIQLYRKFGAIIHIIPYSLDDDKVLQLCIDFGYDISTIIPLGGSNKLSAKGIEELGIEIKIQNPNIDTIILPLGSGGTSNYLAMSMHDKQILAISPFRKPVNIPISTQYPNYQIITNPNQVGFGKSDSKIHQILNRLYCTTGIIADPIYNGKCIITLQSMIENNHFGSNRNILWINTGGLSGIIGYNYRYNGKLNYIAEVKQLLNTQDNILSN